MKFKWTIPQPLKKSKVRYLHAQKKVFLESKTKQGGRATDLTVFFFFRLKYKRKVLNYHVEKKKLNYRAEKNTSLPFYLSSLQSCVFLLSDCALITGKAE